MFCNGDEDNLDRFRARMSENESPETLNRTPTFQRRERLKKAQIGAGLAKSKSGDANNLMAAFQSEELTSGHGATSAQGSGVRNSRRPRDTAKKLFRSLVFATNDSETGLLHLILKAAEGLSSFEYTSCLNATSKIMIQAQGSGSSFLEELAGSLVLLCYAEYVFHKLDFLLCPANELVDLSELGDVPVKPSTLIDPIGLYAEAATRMNELLDVMVKASKTGPLDLDNLLYQADDIFLEGPFLKGTPVLKELQKLIRTGADVLKDALCLSADSPNFREVNLGEFGGYWEYGSTNHKTELALALEQFVKPRAAMLLQQSIELVDGLCGVAEIRVRLLEIYQGLGERFDVLGGSQLYRRRANYNIVGASERMLELRGMAREILESYQDISSDVANPYVSRIRKALLLEARLVYRIVCATTNLSAYRMDQAAVSLCLARQFFVAFAKYINGVSQKAPSNDSAASQSPAAARLKRRNLSAPPQHSNTGAPHGTGRMKSSSEDTSGDGPTLAKAKGTREREKQKRKEAEADCSLSNLAMKEKLRNLLDSLVSSLEQRASVYFHTIFTHHKLSSKPKSTKYQLMKRIESFVKNEFRLRQHTVMVGLVLETTKLERLGVRSVEHAKTIESPCRDPKSHEDEETTSHMPLQAGPNGYFCPLVATSPGPASRVQFNFPVGQRIKDGKTMEFSKAGPLESEIQSRQDEEVKHCDPFHTQTGMSHYPLVYSSVEDLRRHLPNIASLLMSPGNSDCLDVLQPLIHKDADNFSYRLDRVDAGLTLVIVYRAAADWKEFSSIVTLLRGACSLQGVTKTGNS